MKDLLKKKTRKIFLLIIILQVVSMGLIFGEKKKIVVPKSKKEIYNKIKKANEIYLPVEFSAKIDGLLIDLQMRNIPEDMIEFQKEPELYFYFKQGFLPKLLLKNVLPYYENFFSPFEKMIIQSGLFLGIDNYNSYKKFAKEYSFKLVFFDETGYQIRVIEKEGLNGDFGIYHFGLNWRIKKVVLFEERKQSLEIFFFYKKYKKYQLPKRLLVKLAESSEGPKEFFIDFSEYKLEKLKQEMFKR